MGKWHDFWFGKPSSTRPPEKKEEKPKKRRIEDVQNEEYIYLSKHEHRPNENIVIARVYNNNPEERKIFLKIINSVDKNCKSFDNEVLLYSDKRLSNFSTLNFTPPEPPTIIIERRD